MINNVLNNSNILQSIVSLIASKLINFVKYKILKKIKRKHINLYIFYNTLECFQIHL